MSGPFRDLVMAAVCLCLVLTGKTLAVDPEPLSASELFDAFGLDAAAFSRLQHQATPDEELDLVAKILLRLQQMDPADLARWTRSDVNLRTIAGQPEKFQRQLFQLEGRLKEATPLALLEELHQRYALENACRSTIELASGQSVVVFSGKVPATWTANQPAGAQVSARAMFFKAVDDEGAEGATLYFAADRLAWYPDTVLGKLGMDYGLFDTVEQLRPITNQERECFYQMLSAAGRAADDGATPPTGDVVAQLGPLMQAPSEHFGEPYTFRGTARRAVQIHVNEPDAERFSFDHYYELVVFLDIDGVLDVVGEKVRSYPVVFCLRELPPEMPLGENLSAVVEVSGFMFKKWPYTTQMTEQKRPGLRIYSPLLIGRTARLIAEPNHESNVGPIAGGILAFLVAGAAAFVWWFNRREHDARAVLLKRRHEFEP